MWPVRRHPLPIASPTGESGWHGCCRRKREGILVYVPAEEGGGRVTEVPLASEEGIISAGSLA
jgi:hypothetical protein